MKIILTTFMTLATVHFCYCQKAASIKKLESVLESAGKVEDFKSVIDGDVVSGICGLLGGSNVVCGLLSVDNLNENEEQELAKIKSKVALDNFLKSQGLNPDEFYNKLFQERWNTQIQNRFDFLKTNQETKDLNWYATNCIKTQEERGNRCGKSNSITFVFTNSCDESIDIKYAIKRADKDEWSVGVRTELKPGESWGDFSTSPAYVCQYGNKYKVWVRPTRLSNQMKFPPNEEIQKLD